MLHYFIYVILITNAMCISSPGPLTREVGQDVVFMFNATSIIEAFYWGIRDGKTFNLKQGLINYDTAKGGMKLDQNINSTSYAGRVSFVGDLSKDQAWFKISNLNINDTNQYMAKILYTQGASGYQYVSAQLTVIIPSTTTADPSTTSFTPRGIITTQEPTTLPPTNPPILKNLTTTVEVYEEFSQDMERNTSSAFRIFANEFQDAITSAYTSSQAGDKDNFKNVTVIQLTDRKGSIRVTFIVFFKKEISRDKACAPLENAINDWKLGEYKIVPYSLRCSEKKQTPRPPAAETGMHPAIIGGLAVVGVLAIVGLIITIIYVCRKKASKKDYRSSTRPARGYEMEIRHGEPEEQYASVQRPGASGAKKSPEHDQPLPQYAVVDKSKKKKKPKEPGELIYAQLDHDYNASMGTKPPSDRRTTGETDDTVYADIQGDKKKQHPPPQYGNIHDMSYA